MHNPEVSVAFFPRDYIVDVFTLSSSIHDIDAEWDKNIAWRENQHNNNNKLNEKLYNNTVSGVIRLEFY